jgi:hypothetical protein
LGGNPHQVLKQCDRVSTLIRQSKKMQIGTNLALISDWSTQLPFIDAFKSSRAWTGQVPEEYIWNTGEEDKIFESENGWVKSLPSDTQYTSVGTLMYREMDGEYQGGQYIVLYNGEGTIEYGYDAQKDESASRLGRDVINVTPSDSGIWLQIRETDPNGTGNYIRNIRVIPAENEDTYQEQIFNPKFLDRIENFEALRFMDWMKTNDSDQKNWSESPLETLRERPTLESATYSQNGVPVEVMVELANETNTDPWFTIPHMATDEYVAFFAEYVKNHLEPERQVYVEYSNEVWNDRFSQSDWVLEQARKEWGSSKNDFDLKLDWYSKRTTEVTQIWDDVMGGEKERVIGVMGGIAANSWASERVLSYEWTDEPKSHSEYGIDALAIAPYFGYYLGEPKNASEIESWTRESDGGLNKLFSEIKQGGILKNSLEGGALAQSYDWMSDHAELANSEGLELLAYEGGQHLTGLNGVENNDRITQLFIQANRSERMGEIYKEYLQKWHSLGGDLFMNFNDIQEPNKWGSWGLLEHVEDSSSTRYDAVMDAMNF